MSTWEQAVPPTTPQGTKGNTIPKIAVSKEAGMFDRMVDKLIGSKHILIRFVGGVLFLASLPFNKSFTSGIKEWEG
jgi:hypothetical protein